MFRFIVREIKGAWDQISPMHAMKYPAYLGHTVYQSEYDALQRQLREREDALAIEQRTVARLDREREDTELLRKNAFAAYDQQVAKNTTLQEQLDTVKRQKNEDYDHYTQKIADLQALLDARQEE